LHFPDNLDGHSFTTLLSRLNYRRTTFLAVSKSGSTAETLAQFLSVIGTFKALGLEGEMRERCLVLTEPGDRPLRRLAEKFGMPTLDHDPGVGGRYSVLTAVGLLPAFLGGLNAAAVREGARLVLRQTLGEDDSAPVHGAAVTYGLAKKAMRSSVFLPYHDRLHRFARWYRQLAAESLGKNGKGFTPIDALGPVDQHSQLQLYLDGPADKMFTVFYAPMASEGPPVPVDLLGDGALDYLAGKTIGDLAEAECRATVETLTDNGRPVREFALDTIDERTLGALMMHFMLETIILGFMTKVDPFDQPAVEQGKVLAREYLRKT
jgi:glucose-6-phosphate isomerase